MFTDEEDREIFGDRWTERFKAFGRPYNMGAGPLDWFERRGLPLGEMCKDEGSLKEGYDGMPTYLSFGDHKEMFPFKPDEIYD